MEIRNLKLICDGNKIATFDVYVPKYKGTFRGLTLIKGNKGDFVSMMSKYEKDADGGGTWIRCFELDKEFDAEFYATIKSTLKEAMNAHEHEMHKL